MKAEMEVIEGESPYFIYILHNILDYHKNIAQSVLERRKLKSPRWQNGASNSKSRKVRWLRRISQDHQDTTMILKL